jgi:hypothetical protein
MLKVQSFSVLSEANAGLAAAQCLLRTQSQSDPELILVTVRMAYY